MLSSTLQTTQRSSVTRATAAKPIPVVRQTTSRMVGIASMRAMTSMSCWKSCATAALIEVLLSGTLCDGAIHVITLNSCVVARRFLVPCLSEPICIPAPRNLRLMPFVQRDTPKPKFDSPEKACERVKDQNRNRHVRPHRGRRRPLLGRAGAALARQFQDRLGKAAAADRARARHRQARRGRSQHGAGAARPEDRRGHRRGRAGSDRRQARRPFPAGRLADRFGHAVQHERQ